MASSSWQFRRTNLPKVIDIHLEMLTIDYEEYVLICMQRKSSNHSPQVLSEPTLLKRGYLVAEVLPESIRVAHLQAAHG